MNGLEYSIDNGTTWNPIFYWVQGDIDSASGSDIIRDSLGTVDVTTMMASYSDVARYTDSGSGQLVGGYFGFFAKAPITSALTPYIEGRFNDDPKESKRIEIYRVPLADNKANVKFRFLQAGTGTSSWYWAIENWGVYRVPSQVLPTTESPTLKATVTGKTTTITWTTQGTFRLQKLTNLSSGS